MNSAEKTKFYDVYVKIDGTGLKDFLKEYEVEYGLDFKPCAACGEGTNFQEKDFGFHVCSIECLDTLDEGIARFLINQQNNEDKKNDN